VGGVDTRTADFRLISATHRNLEEQVAGGEFRQDFYYRINVITLRVPPLRDRPDDIPLLAEHFIKRFSMETNKLVDSISDKALDILVNYNWPGNIRELENVIERAVVTSKQRRLNEDSFAYLTPGAICRPDSSARTLQEAEKAHIERILTEEDWNISKAAKALDVDRSTLYNKIKKYNLGKT
jgi:two-component system response regulator HydG